MRDFLASRRIELPEGEPDSPPEEESVWGLGNRKQLLVEERLAQGVEVFPGSVAWVRELREAGIKTAVVSSSRNCAAVLNYAGISDLFDTRVDGDTALELQLSGKPTPDTCSPNSASPPSRWRRSRASEWPRPSRVTTTTGHKRPWRVPRAG